MRVNMKHAAILLQKGYVIGLKTDTVYGLAALEQYEYKLYKIKGRNRSKKIVTMVNNYIPSNKQILKLQYKYWPGATTLIFNENMELKSYRYSANYNVNNLLGLVGGKLKITSANYSGEEPVSNDFEFEAKFKKIGLLKELKKERKSNTPSRILLYNNKCTIFIR